MNEDYKNNENFTDDVLGYNIDNIAEEGELVIDK